MVKSTDELNYLSSRLTAVYDRRDTTLSCNVFNKRGRRKGRVSVPGLHFASLVHEDTPLNNEPSEISKMV